MFDELFEDYKKLSIISKREKNIEEIKLVVAILQLLCDRKGLTHEEIKILDEEELEDEDKYLNLMYNYITSLKEDLGSYIINIENSNK